MFSDSDRGKGMPISFRVPYFSRIMFLLRGWQWLQNTLAIKAQNFLLKILAAGPIPNHVAFVMDGNRRYARINHKEVQQGHSDGFIALRRVSC